MICFRYKLNRANSGPAGTLPPKSATGYTHGGWYYGAAIIQDLTSLVAWQAEEVDIKTWAGRNPNPPNELNSSPLPLLHCTMYQAVLDAYGESSPLLAELLWEPPTPYPNDGNEYVWDETTTSWVLA